MEKILPAIKIEVNQFIYLKDPGSTELGRSIIASALKMIDDMGMENFTFRKLAQELNTTESSIYRYFESKHKLLLYFYNWYWSWLELQIVFQTNNLQDPELILKKAIQIIAKPDQNEFSCPYIPIQRMINIVISESSKTYLTKEVDEENKAGFFLAFKKVSKRLTKIMLEIKPDYLYANTLSATCLEGILHQQYFAIHLPSLSDTKGDLDKLALSFYEIIINNLKTA